MKKNQKYWTSARKPLAAGGFSLIELLVAMLIGLLVLAGVIQVIFNSKRSFIDNQETAFIQDNTRYALDIIAKDFRAAGYRGCASNEPNLVNVINNSSKNNVPGAFTLQALTALEAQAPEGITNYKLPDEATDKPDSITLRTVSNENEILLKSHIPQSSTITTWQEMNYPVGTPLMIVDATCQSIAILMADSVGTKKITYGATKNCSTALTSVDPFECQNIGTVPPKSIKPLRPGSNIFPYVANTYFIEKSHLLDDMPALKRRYIKVETQDITYSTEEIAQGVENMQITYGVDLDNNNTVDGEFENADVITAANNWRNVVAMHIVLTLRSNLKVGNTGQPDGYLRKTVASTISLRNRGS